MINFYFHFFSVNIFLKFQKCSVVCCFLTGLKVNDINICFQTYTNFLDIFTYRNDPNFSNRQVCANSVDPDQTAPRG